MPTFNTYNNGRPYQPLRGRYARRQAVEDHFSPCHPVVAGSPTVAEFSRKVDREMRIRYYQPSMVKNSLPESSRGGA